MQNAKKYAFGYQKGYFLYESCNYFNTLTNSRNTRNAMSKLYVTFADNMSIKKNTIFVRCFSSTYLYTVVPIINIIHIQYILAIIYMYLMFRELVKGLKKVLLEKMALLRHGYLKNIDNSSGIACTLYTVIMYHI